VSYDLLLGVAHQYLTVKISNLSTKQSEEQFFCHDSRHLEMSYFSSLQNPCVGQNWL
jgi:hypothetical protein